MGTLSKLRRMVLRDKVSVREAARRLRISRNTATKWLNEPQMSPDGQCKFPRLWPPQTPPGKDVGIMTVRC